MIFPSKVYIEVFDYNIVFSFHGHAVEKFRKILDKLIFKIQISKSLIKVFNSYFIKINYFN